MYPLQILKPPVLDQIMWIHKTSFLGQNVDYFRCGFSGSNLPLYYLQLSTKIDRNNLSLSLFLLLFFLLFSPLHSCQSPSLLLSPLSFIYISVISTLFLKFEKDNGHNYLQLQFIVNEKGKLLNGDQIVKRYLPIMMIFKIMIVTPFFQVKLCCDRGLIWEQSTLKHL